MTQVKLSIVNYGDIVLELDDAKAPKSVANFLDYVRKLWVPLKWLTEFVAKVQGTHAELLARGEHYARLRSAAA